MEQGLNVKLKEVPFKVRLFKVAAINGDMDRVITNDLDETVTTPIAQDANTVRWPVEVLHRVFQQLTGSEKRQCRSGRAHRNHLACCYHAWVSFKVTAQELRQSFVQVCAFLFTGYLRAELAHPRVPACLPR